MFSFQVRAREETQRRLFFYVAAIISNYDTLRGRQSHIDPICTYIKEPVSGGWQSLVVVWLLKGRKAMEWYRGLCGNRDTG
jgi:hypothetical protein